VSAKPEGCAPAKCQDSGALSCRDSRVTEGDGGRCWPASGQVAEKRTRAGLALGVRAYDSVQGLRTRVLTFRAWG
jgi:hypothetical protein